MSTRPFLVLALLQASCSADQSATCTRDTDCPAGQVCSDGRCLPAMSNGPTPPDGAPTPDAGLDLFVFPDAGPGDGLQCPANNNGKIERDEMLFSVPAKVAITTGQDMTVDLAGTSVNGETHWDLSNLGLDQSGTRAVVPVPPWAAADFPGATYASELTASYGVFSKANLLGVFRVTPSSLQMLGIVSDTQTHTKITYDSPLDMLRYPITAADSFKTDAHASGYSDIFPFLSYDESYAIQVVARGKLKLLPGLTLDAVLVRVDQSVYQAWVPLLPSFSNTAFMFVAECYGTVAHVIAKSSPKSLDKVEVDTMWRLAAP